MFKVVNRNNEIEDIKKFNLINLNPKDLELFSSLEQNDNVKIYIIVDKDGKLAAAVAIDYTDSYAIPMHVFPYIKNSNVIEFDLRHIITSLIFKFNVPVICEGNYDFLMESFADRNDSTYYTTPEQLVETDKYLEFVYKLRENREEEA